MKRLAIHDIIRKLQRDRTDIEILGDGSEIRDYLHVSDAARGLVLIATRGSPGEDYNLASGAPVSLMDLARDIARLMGSADARIGTSGHSFPGDTPRWYASIDKIRAIGFEQSVPLESGLEETIAGVLARPIEHGVG